jgi:hypothetical protein
MKEFLKGGFSLNLLSGLVLDKSEAVRMRNSNRMSLAEMYQHMYGPQITMTNLDKMATDLSQIARRTRPWTGKFLHSLIKGYPGFSINNQLNDALTILASRLQHRNEVEAQINEVTVSAINDLPPGTVVLGQAQQCASPGCQTLFVATHPRQKYHSEYCRNMVRRLKRG